MGVHTQLWPGVGVAGEGAADIILAKPQQDMLGTCDARHASGGVGLLCGVKRQGGILRLGGAC